METPERRRAEDRNGAKRLFEYERLFVLGACAALATLASTLGWRVIDLDKAMDAKASKEAVAQVASDVIGLKIGAAFEKESTERRLMLLERQVEALRARERPFNPAPN